MNDTNNTNHDRADETSEGDAKLTAYALGELDPQSDDYKTIAAKLANDPALREQVDQIAQLGSQLTQSYDQANGPGLDDATLNTIVHASAAPIARIHRKPSLARRLLPYAGVAACTTLTTAGIFLATNPKAPATPAGGDGFTTVGATPDAENEDTPAQPVTPEEPPTTKDRFEQLVTLQEDNISLKEVIDRLSEQTDSNIIINWPALELVGIDHDSLVSLKLKDLPAHQVLRVVLNQVSTDAFDDDKAGVRISEEFVQISTLRDLKGDTETRVYDVRDLLVADDVLSQVKHKLLARVGAPGSSGGSTAGGSLFGDDGGSSGLFGGSSTPSPGGRITGQTTNSAPGLAPGNISYETSDGNKGVPNFSQAPSFDLNSGLSNQSSGGQGGASLFGASDYDGEEDLPSRQEKIDQVVELINTAVGDPDEWLDEESTLSEINGNLIVKTTPENHEQLDQLLAQLRVASGGGQGQPEIVKDIDNVVAMMIKDIEQGLIDVEERREQRELERERRERFADLTDNPFKLAEQEPLSTFSVDVDTASYTYGRRSILKDLTLPQPDAVRIEEWINYFDYGYTAPVINHIAIPNGRLTTAALEKIEAADESFVPFATDVEVVQCPWTEGNQLVRIGIQAMEVSQDDRPPAHLVFLLDVSGSMSSADKLGLVQQGMPMLLDQLNDTDKVSIVVYAGASGLVLEAAEAADKNKIKDAIQALKAGGSTAGGEGIKLAYNIAQKHFVAGGVNRVILCTDGDFNVGTSDTDELVELVKTKANPQAEDGETNKGVYLSVMGFGTGNLNDEMMEKITNAGNGNYHYIDSVKEAVNTLSNQAGGTLVTVAKDVKLQVEFNPAKVASYRLIGYENRILRDEDFNNDTVDAGDIGAGHSVTALYEIVPMKQQADKPEEKQSAVDELRYQTPRVLADAADLPELLTLKLRYKPVDAAAEQGTSRKVVTHVPANAVAFDKASEATRFSSSVAALGMILRGSPHKGTATTQWIVDTAANASEHDPNDYRQEFVALATQVDLIHVQDERMFGDQQ